jgi:hypothetical protein
MVDVASFSVGGGGLGDLADEFGVTWQPVKTAPILRSWRTMAVLFGFVALLKASYFLVSLFHFGAADPASCRQVAWGLLARFQ